MNQPIRSSGNLPTNHLTQASQVQGPPTGAGGSVAAGGGSPAHKNEWENIATTGLAHANLSEVRSENKEKAARMKTFRYDLQEFAAGSSTPAENLVKLRDYAFSQEGGVKRFNDAELTQLFHEFDKLGGYDEMDAMMAEAPPEFGNRAQNKEMYARVLLQKNPPDLEMANHIATEIINSAIGDGGVTQLKRFSIAEACAIRAEVRTQRNESPLEIAKDYENAFFHGMDPKHGLEAARLFDLAGDTTKAHKLVNASYLAAVRDGAMDAGRPEATGMALHALALNADTALSDKAIGQMVDRYLAKASDDDVHVLRANLQSVEGSRGKEIDDHIAQGLERKAQGTVSDKTAVDHAVDTSYSYRGLKSSTVGGNLIYGGQLPAHSISRVDVLNFQAILEEPIGMLMHDAPAQVRSDLDAIATEHGLDLEHMSMNDIKDVKVFNKVQDVFIRFQMRSEALDLEDLQSDGHKVFDRTVINSQKLAGLETREDKKGALDWTSVSSSFAMRLGDCRHFAQAKQLMFDVWQGKQVDELIHDTMDSILHPSQAELISEQAEQLMQVELRTFDVTISAPVEMKEKYDAVYQSDGAGGKVHVMTDDPQVMEDHTMTMLVDHQRGTLTRADAFYHDAFQFAEGEVVLDSSQPKAPWSMGTLSAIDKDGLVQDVPVTCEPTRYSGTRHVTNAAIDQSYFVGMPVEIDLVDAMHDRKGIDATLAHIEHDMVNH